MFIEKNKVVTFHYRLREPDQEFIEDSRDVDAVVYLHGHNAMIKGLEDALAGKKSGDHFEATLSPGQAYGLRQEDAVQRVSMKHVINPSGKKTRLEPGMVVQINTNDGPRDVAVVKAGLKFLDVDTNHPLAGKTLCFEIDVLDVRDATPDEIAHGHVHGAGGFHH